MLQEKSKVKSLQTELQSPLNIHRWRKLDGKDPPTLDLIQKIQSLQKRLISRNEEIVDRELSLQEKGTQSFTSLQADLCQEINRGFCIQEVP